MEQQVELLGGAAVPMVSGRATADEVRASLEAVRVAQDTARRRARRETVRARIWLAVAMATIALVAFGVGPRLARGRHEPTRAATAVRPVPVVATREPVAPATNSLATEPTIAAAPVAAAPVVAKPDEGCDTALMRRAPWRLSPPACARAFAADPSNAVLALAIAHAEHAHGSPAESAQWAERARALDPNAAEAYVLIARSAARRGRHEDARAAYRRYLELAPRGWHRAEAARAAAVGASAR